MKKLDRGRYILQFESTEMEEGAGLSHLDSHADTCIGGPDMILIDGTVSKRVEVSGFTDDFGTIKDIPVGTCAATYYNPEPDKTYMLLFGKSLYFGNRITHSLLCPKHNLSQQERCGGYNTLI